MGGIVVPGQFQPNLWQLQSAVLPLLLFNLHLFSSNNFARN